MKPGKQRRQDLCWKAHDRTQPFVFRSDTMCEVIDQKRVREFHQGVQTPRK